LPKNDASMHGLCSRRTQRLTFLTVLVILEFLQILITRSSATAETAHDAWNGHSRSLKVIHCCASRHGIYDFLL